MSRCRHHRPPSAHFAQRIEFQPGAHLFAQSAGIKLLHVPYRGASPAITDLLGGQVSAIVTSSASIDPMVEDRKARVLASFTTARLGSVGGAPTMSEAAGIKGLEVPVWVGLLAPAKTPPAAIERLAAEILAICQLEETQERFKGRGALAASAPPCSRRAERARRMCV